MCNCNQVDVQLNVQLYKRKMQRNSNVRSWPKSEDKKVKLVRREQLSEVSSVGNKELGGSNFWQETENAWTVRLVQFKWL